MAIGNATTHVASGELQQVMDNWPVSESRPGLDVSITPHRAMMTINKMSLMMSATCWQVPVAAPVGSEETLASVRKRFKLTRINPNGKDMMWCSTVRPTMLCNGSGHSVNPAVGGCIK